MTDDELTALVANLAIENEKTAQQIRETDRILKEMSKETDQALKDSAKETNRVLAERSKETDRVLAERAKETDRSLKERAKETDRKISETERFFKEMSKETDKVMQETSRKLASIGKMIGGISKNQGDIAEEFFFHSLAKDNHLGAVKFDDISMNLTKRRGKLEEEYDLFLTNGNAIGIVEVKYKLHENDLKKLDRKLKNFKLLYPIYQDYTLYGAIASFHINEDAKEAALNKGYFVLQRCGDVIQTESRQVHTF